MRPFRPPTRDRLPPPPPPSMIDLLSSAWSDEETVVVVVLLTALTLARCSNSSAWRMPVLAAAGAILIPLRSALLSVLVSAARDTRTSYPYLVVIPHCFVSSAVYRQERERREPALRSTNFLPLPTLALGFLCYGFGGTVSSDLLMGLPVTAFVHSRIFPSWVLGWLLVWCFPSDLLYKAWSERRGTASFLRLLLNAFDAIDAITTPMGRVSRSAREFGNRLTAPVVAGVFAGTAGASIRYVERVHIQRLSDEAGSSQTALAAAVARSLGYVVFWHHFAVTRCSDPGVDPVLNHCDDFGGPDSVRIAMIYFHVVWVLACDYGLASGHPFVYASDALFRALGKAS